MGQRWRSGWATRCKTPAEEAKMTVRYLCTTRLPRAARGEDLYAVSWSCHVQGTPQKFLFLSLKGEEGTGAEPAAWRPAQHLLIVALHSAGAHLALGSATPFSEQSYSPTYSSYSDKECFVVILPRETVKYQQFSNTGLNSWERVAGHPLVVRCILIGFLLFTLT